jgi:methylglutamate dehydrogenase subunit D
MLERASALAGMAPVEDAGFRLAEAPGFTLTQISGADRALKKHVPSLPDSVGVAVEAKGRTVLRISPQQAWLLGEPMEAADGLVITPLSSARTRIALDGPHAREMLAKCVALDFHPKVFTPGKFAMSGIHHMPVVIHCIAPEQFHLYALRTFARSMWEVLADAGHS